MLAPRIIDPTKSWADAVGSWGELDSSVKWNSTPGTLPITEEVYFNIGHSIAYLLDGQTNLVVEFTIGADLEHELQAVYDGTAIFTLEIDQVPDPGITYYESSAFSFRGELLETSEKHLENSVVFDMRISEFAVDGDGIFLDFVTFNLGADDSATSAGSFVNVEVAFETTLDFSASYGLEQTYNYVVSFAMGTSFEYFNTQWNRVRPESGDWTADTSETGTWTPDNPVSGDWN